MHEQLKFKTLDYIGKRHMMRLCSDAYGKGIVRSNQESINLRIHGTRDDVTSAESFHTASFVQFPGIDLVQWREAVYTNSNFTDMLSAVAIDWRNPKRTTPYMRNFVYLYGHRPKDIDEVWYMSPYEFMVYWSIDLAQYPLDAEIPDDDDAYEAKLTSHGKAKLRHAKSSKEKNPKLIAGIDYVVKERLLQQTWYNWLPFPENESTLPYRHDWVSRLGNASPCSLSFESRIVASILQLPKRRAPAHRSQLTYHLRAVQLPKRHAFAKHATDLRSTQPTSEARNQNTKGSQTHPLP